VAILSVILLIPGDTRAWPLQDSASQASSSQSVKIPPDQLDSLVAPIALYPDPLLAQVLAASTYPLEIILLQRWLGTHSSLKGQALADAVSKESWDASVKALAPLPDVVKRLGDDIQWTTDLGNAFLAQQSDVMDAVQRMRRKAQEKGTLQSSQQQKVETRVVESKSVIVIEPSSPEVVYVPSYDPVVVYGPAVYPYPPIYYPAWGYAATAAVSFGVGVMMGAFWGGGWGWGCGWGGGNVYVNNNFNRNTNINGGNRNNINGGNRNNIGNGNRPSQLPSNAGGLGNGGRSNWQHDPSHRGGTPYRDRATADRFGGNARGDSLAQRRAGAQQRISRQGGNLSGNRGSGGLGNSGGIGSRGNAGGNFGGGAGSGLGSGAGSNNRVGGGGAANRSAGSGLGGGADRIGSRDVSRSGGGNRDAFGGGNRSFSGSSSRGASSRGSSSFGSRSSGGGGFSRGGGGARGGGRRR
jgi:hypothetical protein